MVTVEIKCEACEEQFVVATEAVKEIIGCPLCLAVFSDDDDFEDS